ncbi:MAG: biotin-dependent carboxyltransferase family protein [Aquabacterium sp.]
MIAELAVLQPGAACTVQDSGRRGLRHIGMPLAGALDPLLLACANIVVGEAADAAGIEIALAGPTLQALLAPVRVALAGEVDATVHRADGSTAKVAAFTSITLAPGDRLAVGACRRGMAYLAISGGCRVPPQLGSRSTYARAALGGVKGRALAAGDLLPCSESPGGAEQQAAPWLLEAGPIRVILGPQLAHFTAAACDTLFGQGYVVTRDSDRMGMRLSGPALEHAAPGGADIHSEGVVPGSIQVPGNGAPIILLADAQTVGGYAKIGTVIRADLPRLAHLRPGDSVRFARSSVAQALAARQAQAQAWAHWCARIQPLRQGPDLAALYNANLISGGIDAARGDLPWEH